MSNTNFVFAGQGDHARGQDGPDDRDKKAGILIRVNLFFFFGIAPLVYSQKSKVIILILMQRTHILLGAWQGFVNFKTAAQVRVRHFVFL